MEKKNSPFKLYRLMIVSTTTWREKHHTSNPHADLPHLSGDVVLASLCPEGFVCIGVPIGTDDFVQNFVVKTCRDIIDDVEKLERGNVSTYSD